MAVVSETVVLVTIVLADALRTELLADVVGLDVVLVSVMTMLQAGPFHPSEH